MIISCPTLRFGPYLFYIEKFITQFKTAQKMIGHRARFQENDNLPLWRGPAATKKPVSIFLMRALITRGIMRSVILGKARHFFEMVVVEAEGCFSYHLCHRDREQII